MMDFNGKLVAFGLSIWHYNFALNGLGSQSGMVTLHEGLLFLKAWEGIQFIG